MARQYNVVWQPLILCVERASCRPSGVWNFEMATRFFKSLWIPEVMYSLLNTNIVGHKYLFDRDVMDQMDPTMS